MPAVSTKQRQLMAIAEHAPSKLYKKNRGVLDMSHQQLHDFAATKGLKSKDTHSFGPKPGTLNSPNNGLSRAKAMLSKGK